MFLYCMRDYVQKRYLRSKITGVAKLACGGYIANNSWVSAMLIFFRLDLGLAVHVYVHRSSSQHWTKHKMSVVPHV
jgi:hypothetical protein